MGIDLQRFEGRLAWAEPWGYPACHGSGEVPLARGVVTVSAELFVDAVVRGRLRGQSVVAIGLAAGVSARDGALRHQADSAVAAARRVAVCAFDRSCWDVETRKGGWV